MGEHADDILDGDVCQVCGEWFHDGDSPGYPRTCESCQQEDKSEQNKKKKGKK